MDYKIMYEQAIKRAKAMISVAANQEEVYNGVITIFPELKESEDERIRKDLLGCLHTLPNHFSHNGSLVTEWIAWLEKQGEQKPVVIPKFRVGDFVKDANYHGEPTYEIVGMDGECYICQYRGNKSMGDRSVMHFCFDNPYLRLVEQKPVEDINGEDYGIDSLWHAHRILEKTLGKVEGYQSDDGILEHECAISAVKKLYEQKPDWNEKDEEMFNYTINLLNYNFGCRTFLKSLKFRLLLPLIREFDKEEGSIIDHLIAICDDAMCYDTFAGCSKKDIEKYKNFLTNLKFGIEPQKKQWKPSDEQMKVLDAAVMHSHLTTAEYDGLVKLREQLKKLREE